ncbi:MAG: SH3 domain-containing protein [Myxococcota bacterium]|nr:SH3 domain-containing protein [Myxococcota bacterium]
MSSLHIRNEHSLLSHLLPLLLICFSSLNATQSHAVEPDWDQLRRRAQEHFWAGRLEQAATSYQKLIEQGAPGRAALWYNFSLSKAETGAIGEAIHGFEQTLQLNPSDEEAYENLLILQRRALDRAIERGGERLVLPELGRAGGLLALLNLALLERVGLIAWALFFLSLTYRRRLGARLSINICVVLTALISLAAAGLWSAHELQLSGRRYAVVIKKEGQLRRGPAERFPRTDRLSEGVTVELIGERGPWRLAEAPGGREGWISSRELREINKAP